ncbi:MAG: hypothetical protein MUE30_17640 [Spirosomaceae bacterium]|nr:hypothetical protein [Spirosomataceae bacterium]
MKKLLVCLFLLAGVAQAQNEKYTQAMTAALMELRSQSENPNPSALTEVTNRFERIASAEPKEWLPRYHAAFCYSNQAFMTQNMADKDRLLDKADALVEEAEKISANNDELYVLKAYIAQARLAADPMSRWQTYGAVFGEMLEKAKAVNADNPRIYMLQGTNLFYTPEQFGGGKQAAKPLLEQALEKFANFKPASALHPMWGKGQAEAIAKQCQ